MPMLNDLLKPWGVNAPSLQVQDMALDSRLAQQGDLFIALKGHQTDGHRYIKTAIERGVSAVLLEADSSEQHGSCEVRDKVPCLSFWELGKHLSVLAGQFYDHPAQNLQLIGVTGTNGKSTITHLIANWCQLLGHRAAVMGTLGNGLWQQIKPSLNTTASAIESQQQLAEFVAKRVDTVAMEVSSHGLAQHRVDGLPFQIAVYSNLSRDHLDYHGSFADYGAVKQRLFSFTSLQDRVINADDAMGRDLLHQYPSSIAYSLAEQPKHTGPCIWAESFQFNERGVQATINSSFGSGQLQTALLGQFNLENTLAALGAMLALGYAWSDLLNTADHLSPVSGRMELIQRPEQPSVVVDYAHTPDALEKVLDALSQHCQGDVWCVFGCGGDRDRGKRPLMAQTAEQGAAHLIITDDNPRHEDPTVIVTNMLEGLQHPERIQVIHNRGEAIQHAIIHASPQDWILIAGKGHEDYQITKKGTFKFSDRARAINALENRA